MARQQYIDETTGFPIYPEDPVVEDPYANIPWIPPDASFGNNPSGDINNQNPNADPSLPFVQGGETGGWIDGIGVTAGEGQSDTIAQQQAALAAALAAGVPAAWANAFLAANPGDHGRLLAAYNSGQTGSGPDAQKPPGGGTGAGGGTSTPRTPFNLDPPGPLVLPPFHAPTWTEPAAFVGPKFNEPAPFSYADFKAPTLEEARNDPGFQFSLDEGRRAMEASAAAKGNLRTGGTVKALMGYGQRLADQNYGNVYTRNQGTYTTNRNNAAANYTTNYNNAKGAFDTEYAGAKDTYDTGYQGAKDTFANLFKAAEAEYKPQVDAATQSYETAYNVWLQKFLAAQKLEEDND